MFQMYDICCKVLKSTTCCHSPNYYRIKISHILKYNDKVYCKLELTVLIIFEKKRSTYLHITYGVTK